MSPSEYFNILYTNLGHSFHNHVQFISLLFVSGGCTHKSLAVSSYDDSEAYGYKIFNGNKPLSKQIKKSFPDIMPLDTIVKFFEEHSNDTALPNLMNKFGIFSENIQREKKAFFIALSQQFIAFIKAQNWDVDFVKNTYTAAASSNSTIEIETYDETAIEKGIIERNSRLDDRIVGWIKKFPQLASSFDEWLIRVLDKNDIELLQAFSLFTSENEINVLKTAIQSKNPMFFTIQQAIADRFHLFLGGLHGITQSPNVSNDLSEQNDFISSLQKMINSFVGVSHRRVNDVATTLTLLENGNLLKLRTSEADFELWFVLKSIQEFHENAKASDLKGLLNFVSEIVKAEIEVIGLRISDQRHSWWAIRTLADFACLLEDKTVIEEYTIKLLSLSLFIPSEETAKKSILPENIVELITRWELVNIIEILQLENLGSVYSNNTINSLNNVKLSLVREMLHSELPNNMRTATVEYRVGLTYLKLQATGLWGKNI